MNIDERWNKKAKELFLGKKIVGISYMSQGEAEELGWYKRPVVLQLDDGSLIYPSMDDEGNDGGALFAEKNGVDISLPVL